MDKQISKLKFFSYIFSLILVIQLLGTVLFFRNSNTLHSASLNKIDSLISEIGDLKDQNLILSQELDEQVKLNQINDETIRKIYIELNTNQNDQSLKENLNNYKQFLEDERRKLANANSKLSNQLDQKNQEVDQLKKEQIVEKQLEDLNSKLYAVLFLGENQKLTDSIILAIVNPEKQKTTLVSIPRDLYFEGRKINEYYEFYGMEKASEVVKKISGIKVDKYVEFNFNAFTELIDSLGGVDIEVDKKIVDKSYPTGKFDYKTVVFEPGMEKMTGERALEYARSRKSTSDFDRSLRQQKIILALKEKLKSSGVLKNLDFYVNTYQNLQHNLITNFNILEAIQMFELYKNYQIYAGNILSNENFLYSSKSVTGQSILLPKNGSFLSFQQKLLEII